MNQQGTTEGIPAVRLHTRALASAPLFATLVAAVAFAFCAPVYAATPRAVGAPVQPVRSHINPPDTPTIRD
jgi:hypothetical protein